MHNNEQGELQNEECAKKDEDVMKLLSEKVESIYFFRDHYFENHKIENAIHKKDDVEKLMNETLDIFKENELKIPPECKARYSYLKGRLLNVAPEFNKASEELLSKAIKLDPKLVEAWNELGECYWKCDEIKKAINCFEGALKQQKNKVSFRSLSMLLRQEGYKNREDKLSKIKKGLEYAKQAVELDPQDGLSWSVLGNAHLSSFFGVQQDPKTLKQCLKAYCQAEKDVVAQFTADLHYNKGMTLKYEEEFLAALESFSKAMQYDPTWEPPKVQQKRLLKYLHDMNELVATSGKMKAKRLQQILNSISSVQLGPYSGGTYKSPTGYSVKLEEVSLNDLQIGINSEKVVVGKVVCSVHNEDTVPFTFCLVDKSGTCVAVTVFNLADGKGVIIGDSVAIPEPYITDIDFKYNEVAYKFRLIRIESPLVLVVNNKKVGSEYLAGVQMSVFKRLE